MLLSILASVLSAAAIPATAAGASLVEVTNFGTNPSNLRMYLYVPNNVAAHPGVLVAVHYCGGSGPAFYSGTEFASLADRYGFIIIYPSVNRTDNTCFDVSSPQALKHDGGSDPVGIVSMVRYVLAHYPADANLVYAVGASSGAMMTNVLLGDYPDVFKAGSAFAGVPFGCFATTNGSYWNSTCSSGNMIKTAQQWGDLVRAAYPDYTGPRPRMQLWHGNTDTTLAYANFGEEIKQWTNVLGLSQTPTSTDSPQSNWTRTRYGGSGVDAPVEGISIAGVGHALPQAGQAAYAIAFFGLDKPAGGGDSTPPSVPGTPTASDVTSSSLSLTWTASTDNVGVTGYTVYQRMSSGDVSVASPSSNSVVLDGLSPSTSYTYYVKARDGAGNTSAASGDVSVTTQPGTATCSAVPAAPANVSATATSSSQINLSWASVTPPANCSVSYTVYRSTISGFTPSSSNQVATGLTTTSDSSTGLSASTTYYFIVLAVDAAGSSANSAQVSATTQAGSTGTTPCANPITFTQDTNNFNTTGAVCYRTSATINGWGCYNMDGRSISVNNTPVTCGQMPMPAKWSDGYLYFAVTAGTYPWAGIYSW